MATAPQPDRPLLAVHSFPQAILHVDADGFFASVEQALNPKLCGKPVVVGAERGMVIALSYEAKARGVKRGMLMHEAKNVCPGLICVSGHYEDYGVFSRRMFSILRRTTPQVEEYSIDEAFADLKGLRRLHRMGYAEMARRAQQDIHREMGITVSVGVSLTKSLAKLASKFRKPQGLTIVPGRRLHEFLPLIPLSSVWGFGAQSVALLSKHGLKTAWDYVMRPIEFAKRLLGKVGVEIWQELRGVQVNPVMTIEKTTYASISKFRTFTPATDKADIVLARLMRNIENATAKARRFHLAACRIILVLRDKKFHDTAIEVRLSRPSAALLDLTPIARKHFAELFHAGASYRATGVILCDLKEDKHVQLQLGFEEDPLRVVHVARVAQAIDTINHRFGRHTIGVADALAAQAFTDDEKTPGGGVAGRDVLLGISGLTGKIRRAG